MSKGNSTGERFLTPPPHLVTWRKSCGIPCTTLGGIPSMCTWSIIIRENLKLIVFGQKGPLTPDLDTIV